MTKSYGFTTEYGLGSKVRLAGSGEAGTVVGVAVNVNTTAQYLVRYMAGDGRLIETWWHGDALHADGEAEPKAAEAPAASPAEAAAS